MPTTLKFCPDCENILRPREDKHRRILLDACRWCPYKAEAESNFVYDEEIQHSADDRMQLVQDVASQPTLPRTKAVICHYCKNGEVGFFQDKLPGEQAVTLFFVCSRCGKRLSSTSEEVEIKTD